jgi:ketosteroid isomerase-like protein
MDSQETAAAHRELIRAHFAAKERRDEEALRSQLSEDVRWWVPQSAAERGLAPRVVEGREQVVALLMTLGLYVPERSWTIHHLLADEHAAAAHGTMRTHTVTGAPYENHYVFVFEFSDGLISQVWEHLDTAYLFPRLDGA